MKKLQRGVVTLGVLAMAVAALVAPSVQAAPGVGVASAESVEYWDAAQRAGGTRYDYRSSVAVTPDAPSLA